MVVVVDYGMGNLRSVSKAIEHLGGRVKVSSNPKDVERADKLVLPGVGAFGDAVKGLRSARLFEPIQNFIRKGKPFLGICLGLQLLFEASEESPNVKGLGIFSGRVRGFRSRTLKVPHMGWNSVKFLKKHPLVRGIPDESFFYFVHSFYPVPKERSLVVGECSYGKERFAAAAGNAASFAVQFHPEKSQSAGLKLLKNFLAW